MSLHHPHPEGEELLRMADGELPARRAAKVRAHLEACWQCRAELEELQAAINACVRYRKEVLHPHLPAPPAPWPDIYRGFDAVDASLARPPLAARLLDALSFPFRSPRRWAPAAIAITLVAVLVYELRVTPSVQAAQLLRKAVAAAETRPAGPRRQIRIRTRKGQLTRPVGASLKLASADTGELETLFQQARYDWEDPLTARAYQAWRDQLSGKRDEVSVEGDRTRIRTSSGAGELARASLTLRTSDLHPLEERLEFRNSEWVEITEVAEQPMPDIPVASTPAPVATAPLAAPPATPATAGDELQVLAALHRVGADLGDPVEVTRSGGRILVSGVGVAPERREQIEGVVARLPKVVVRFSDPPPAVFEAEKPATPATPPPGPEASRVEKQVGGRRQFEQFAGQLMDLSDAMMARAYALRHLAQRFPRPAEAGLAAHDREVLRSLEAEHASALARQAGEIERVLKPVLTAMGGTAPAAPAVPSAESWQAAAEDLFRAARRVETEVAAVVGAAPSQASAVALPSRLLADLAELRARARTAP